ncbi:hypothetical protein L5515_019547 [Caenorhabditis briggsae]|uniref:Zinc finger PHD-type domain-containing protein n=1 Tax=Caenorhabditis briggsae TaxID=6238 RepID=A0AAE9JTZ4_CAEBR|nr:hypothetical protein L5515_019547 [Caenorhabditis briggsae]
MMNPATGAVPPPNPLLMMLAPFGFGTGAPAAVVMGEARRNQYLKPESQQIPSYLNPAFPGLMINGVNDHQITPSADGPALLQVSGIGDRSTDDGHSTSIQSIGKGQFILGPRVSFLPENQLDQESKITIQTDDGYTSKTWIQNTNRKFDIKAVLTKDNRMSVRSYISEASRRRTWQIKETLGKQSKKMFFIHIMSPIEMIFALQRTNTSRNEEMPLFSLKLSYQRISLYFQDGVIRRRYTFDVPKFQNHPLKIKAYFGSENVIVDRKLLQEAKDHWLMNSDQYGVRRVCEIACKSQNVLSLFPERKRNTTRNGDSSASVSREPSPECTPQPVGHNPSMNGLLGRSQFLPSILNNPSTSFQQPQNVFTSRQHLDQLDLLRNFQLGFLPFPGFNPQFLYNQETSVGQDVSPPISATPSDGGVGNFIPIISQNGQQMSEINELAAMKSPPESQFFKNPIETNTIFNASDSTVLHSITSLLQGAHTSTTGTSPAFNAPSNEHHESRIGLASSVHVSANVGLTANQNHGNSQNNLLEETTSSSRLQEPSSVNTDSQEEEMMSPVSSLQQEAVSASPNISEDSSQQCLTNNLPEETDDVSPLSNFDGNPGLRRESLVIRIPRIHIPRTGLTDGDDAVVYNSPEERKSTKRALLPSGTEIHKKRKTSQDEDHNFALPLNSELTRATSNVFQSILQKCDVSQIGDDLMEIDTQQQKVSEPKGFETPNKRQRGRPRKSANWEKFENEKKKIKIEYDDEDYTEADSTKNDCQHFNKNCLGEVNNAQWVRCDLCGKWWHVFCLRLDNQKWTEDVFYCCGEHPDQATIQSISGMNKMRHEMNMQNRHKS